MVSADAFDRDRLGSHLAGLLGDDWRLLTAEQITGGLSNLTYRLTSRAGNHVILRRPPLSSVLPTAHDMRREFRVQAALAATDVPVPAMITLIDDPAIADAPCYVMADVSGVIARDHLPDQLAPTLADRRELASALVHTLAAIHGVDPHSVGLGDFGRPDGYVERQLRRWSAQWEATRAGLTGQDHVDDLLAQLSSQQPARGDGVIIHGDFRIDNTILAPQPPARIRAVLDWELSTLGDPLADLGLLLVYWSQADDDELRRAATFVGSVTAEPGFPTRAQVAREYAAATGRDISPLPWYVGLGFAKLAIVCAGIATRQRAGAMPGSESADAASRIGPLAEVGLATLRSGHL